MKFLQLLVLSICACSFACGQVANDNCTTAQAITIPSSGNVCVTSTTVNAISDNFTSTCDTGTPGNEVWFTFIATGSQNTVTVTPTGSPAIQQAIVALDGTGCADNAFNICNGSTTNNGSATATWTFTPGTQVWISVESNNGTQGSFQLCITSTTPPPTPGSSCSTATPLCNLNNFTLNPFPGNNNGFIPQCFLNTALQQPVFYQFTVGQTGILAWTADVQGTAEYDWALYNITGGCPSNSTTPVACNYNFANGNSNIIGMQAGPGTCSGEFCDPVTVTAGQTYMLIIDNFSNNSAGFIMSFAGSTFLMAPTAQFTVNPTTACGSANVTITNSSVSATSYNWNFGNGNTSTLQNPPAQTYSTPGTYLISLTATSSAGCTNTTSQSVTVNANHTITAGSNQTVCVGSPLTSITMTLGGGAIGATSAGLPPGVTSNVSAGVVTLTGTPTTAGTYNYTITTTGNACTVATATGTITVISIPTPTITTVPPTCSAAGSATVSNYDATLTYTFTPTGPTVGAGGAISGMTTGTNYTLIAGNGTCNSIASTQFNIAAQLTTPATPTITVIPPTCSANGSASISNYDGTLTYTFTPSGPTVGAGGAISGMTAGTNYTVTAGNGSCTSAPSASFSIAAQLTTPAVPTITTTPATCSSNGTATISNYNASLTYTFTPTGPTAGAGGAISGMSVGTNYTVIAGNGSCSSAASASFSIAAQLATPAVPTTLVVAPTCSANGSASISNYDGTLTYTFTPSGPTVGAGGTISGMTAGTNYTVTAGNGSCTSAPSASFSIAAQLTTPAVPTITTTPATCSSNGTATITNYNASLTYTFTPSGPTAGAGGVISGMTVGTSYTVIAGNGSCNSAASASFSIAAQLATPTVPITSVVPPTCSANGSASITNYDVTLTYTFTPSGPTVGAGGAISGMTAGTNYTVTAGNGSCTSAPSASFSIAAQLTTPAVPTITTTPATCSSNGTATITNYNAALTYTFSPTGPTAGAGGVISGMTAGTSYTVTAGNGSCTSAPSSSFSIQAPIQFPSIPIQVDNPNGCAPHTATLSATNLPGIEYQWTANGTNIGNGVSLTSVFNQSGCYTIQLTATNSQGCTSTTIESNFVCVEADPIASFTANPSIFTSNSETVNFTNNSQGAVNYSWDFGDNTNSTEESTSHFYSNLQGGVVVTLTAVSALGCSDQTSITINFQEQTIFYVPNSFTPDQDEYNQTWGPVFTQGFDPFNFDLYVFNRWGEVIWESHDASKRWDGTYGSKGTKCPDGVYTWKIGYKPKETDEKVVVTGHINLIR